MAFPHMARMVAPQSPSPSPSSSQSIARIPLFLLCIGFTLYIGLLPVTANATEEPLTLEAAQQLAIVRSRQLPAQEMAIAASRDMAVAAGQLPDPVLKMGIDNLPVNGAERFSTTDDFMTMRRIGLAQEWTRADKRQLRAERYEREADKSAAEKDVALAAIERNTALAWIERYYAEKVSDMIAQQATQAKLEIEAAESAYRSGHGSQADIFAARSALANVEDRAAQARQHERNAATMLARWVGDAAGNQLADRPSFDVMHLDLATVDEHLARHPEIIALNKQVDMADADARLAAAHKHADWNIELTYQQRGPAYSNMISVGVSLPLQWDQGHRQDRELSAKLATLEQARAERDEMLRDHVAQTRNMLDEWQNDRARSVRYEQELIPLASRRMEAVMAAYRGGTAGLADVLAAHSATIDIKLQAWQLEADGARLWAQLNFLIPTVAENPSPRSTAIKDMP